MFLMKFKESVFEDGPRSVSVGRKCLTMCYPRIWIAGEGRCLANHHGVVMVCIVRGGMPCCDPPNEF